MISPPVALVALTLVFPFSLSAATGTGTPNTIPKWTDAAGTLADSAVTEVAGKVGIGTASPGAQLHIFGLANADVFAGMGVNLATGPAMNYGYAGASFGRGAGFFNVRPTAGATPPNPSLRFMTADVQRMIITNVGNVGIGTLSPGFRLEVNGVVSSVAGGFRFPDATVQTTAFALPFAKTTSSSSTLFDLTNTGTGSVASFSQMAATASPALSVSTTGPDAFAAEISSSSGTSTNVAGGALHLVVNGTLNDGLDIRHNGDGGNGIFVDLRPSLGLNVAWRESGGPITKNGIVVNVGGPNTAAGVEISSTAQALQIDTGGLKVSSIASATLTNANVLFEIPDNTTAGTPATSTLPATAPAGQIIFVSCSDPDGCIINGCTTCTLSINSTYAVHFIRTSDGWKRVL